jgi:hypothetical protein
MTDRTVPHKQCASIRAHSAHVSNDGSSWCNGLTVDDCASLSLPPEEANGVMKYRVIAVGETYIDIWDEHTTDEWHRPSFTRLVITHPQDFRIGIYVHVKVSQLVESEGTN